MVDEEHMVEVLDNESDYKKGLEKLDMKDRDIVQELISLGGGEKKAPSKKCNILFFSNIQSLVN